MEYISDIVEIEKARYFFEQAALEAKNSKCTKSQRGVVIVKNGEIIGSGYNMPTIEELCNPCIREHIHNNSQVEMCSAIHAEQMAIVAVANSTNTLEGAVMYHIKTKNGEMQPSGKPSCTVCSRIILPTDLKFVLWHEEGYAIYGAKELNELSFEYFTKAQGEVTV